VGPSAVVLASLLHDCYMSGIELTTWWTTGGIKVHGGACAGQQPSEVVWCDSASTVAVLRCCTLSCLIAGH
jgi:hypothetical protein